MAVRKPLEKKTEEKSVDVDALIEKGAKVKEDAKKGKWTFINIRISSTMLKEIDEAVEKRIGITRTGWLLETLHDKLTQIKRKK